MNTIGIIGAGVSALHLGLTLRKAEVPVTLYAPQRAESIASGRMTNSVAHMNDTIERERDLEIEFWDRSNSRICNYREYSLRLPDGTIEQSRGALNGDERCVDYRLYLPRLMSEFERRGGIIRYERPTAENFHELYDKHRLLAIGCGKKHDGFGEYFPRIEELSRHDEAQRLLCAGIYRGVAAPDPLAVTFNISVEHGEMIELPIETAYGPLTALLMECRRGGDLTDLPTLDYAADPDAFNRRILDAVSTHFPNVCGRVDRDSFGLVGADSLLQGAVKPVTRRSWSKISDGCFAFAIGDLRCTMDPLTGQGANLASYGACALGDHIAESDGVYDTRFCEAYDERVRYRVAGVVNFNNALLEPAEHTKRLIHAMPKNTPLCDDFSARFAQPETMWFDVLKDAATCDSYLARFARTEAAA